MDKKRWVLTAVVVAVVVSVIDAVCHGVFLKDTYAQTASIWRPMTDMNKLMPYGWLSTLVVSFIFVYIYHKGYEGKTGKLAEGLRFGFIIGLFTAIPTAVWSYITWPMTIALAFSWFVITMADTLAAGAVIGVMYKKAS